MKSILTKLGIALTLGLLWQFVVGWAWSDFISRSIIITLAIPLIYLLERWLKHRNSTPAA